MQLSHGLLIATVGLAGLGGLATLGESFEKTVVGMAEADLPTSGVKPAVGSAHLAGLLPVGVAVRMVRRYPTLANKVGFRGATAALGVMADEGLVRGGAGHASRVAKIEKPGGAWRAALPFHANAALDAGRRGVGSEMFDGLETFGYKNFAKLKRFGDENFYVDVIDHFDLSRFSPLTGYSGDIVAIPVSQRLRRAVIRRSVNRLSDGRLPWDAPEAYDSATVARIKRLRNPTVEHYKVALAGGAEGIDVDGVKRAIEREVVLDARLVESLVPDLEAPSSGRWASIGAYQRIDKHVADGDTKHSMRFSDVPIQHAADLKPQTARVTIPNLASESGFVQRLAIEIAPGFNPETDFGPWLTKVLGEHPRHGKGGNTKPSVFMFSR